MQQIKLIPPSAMAYTAVQNVFIDRWLSKTNGEFIKVYLYMLRLMEGEASTLSTGQMADKLLMMEADIIRALKYWDREHVINLNWNGKELVGIEVNILSDEEDSDLETELDANNLPDASPKPAPPAKPQYDAEAYRQLVYYAEALFGKTLSQTDTEIVLSLVDTYLLTFDVAEYLIEMVALKKKNLQYMEKVAASWADQGVDTVEMAKEVNDRHNGNYYKVFKALGIYNHQPQAEEKKMIDKWIKDYNFAIEVVEKACGITITSIHEPSLKYTDSILTSWYSSGIMSLEAVETAEKAFRANKKQPAENTAKKTNTRSKNKFHNHDQRKYDFDYLEKRMDEMLDKKTTKR